LRKLFFILIFFLLISNQAFCQKSFLSDFFKDFTIYLSGNYISSATIQLNPYSTDIIERNITDEVNGGYGYGLSIKKKIISDNIYFSFSTEYLRITDNSLSTVLENDTNFIPVHVTENIKFVPVEFALYFSLPQALDNLNIFLGGGAGIYFGDRSRRMVGYETITTSKTATVNILVLFGMEYMMDKHISLLLEMRVRQGEFKVSNHFPVDNVTLEGVNYQFQQDLNSKVFVDGLKLSLGIGYTF